MSIFLRGNGALSINPLLGSTLLSPSTVFCFTAPESDRVFHYLFTVALLVGSVTYFAQASDLGWSAVRDDSDVTHQLFYAKYINWVVSFPSVALALGLLSGVS
ncbi:hypothetical protein F4818DRAFT_443733 [Hypoxylon cercidicola]|nr:hypothetical protein F4818DRAFT_443733 [Hypoxylon cercidicola]